MLLRSPPNLIRFGTVKYKLSACPGSNLTNLEFKSATKISNIIFAYAQLDVCFLHEKSIRYYVAIRYPGEASESPCPISLTTLSHRTYKTKIGSFFSNNYSQEEGVPKGSVLSCRVFALAFNDISKCLPENVKSIAEAQRV